MFFQEPEVIVKEIEILSIATSFHHLYPELQEQADLLICCVCKYIYHSFEPVIVRQDRCLIIQNKIIFLFVLFSTTALNFSL